MAWPPLPKPQVPPPGGVTVTPGAPGTPTPAPPPPDPFGTLAALYQQTLAGGGGGQSLPPAVVIQPQATGGGVSVGTIGIVLTLLAIGLAWYYWKHHHKAER